MFLTGVIFGLLLSAGALAIPAPAYAADDDDEAIDQKFIRGVLEGLGLERDGKQLDYHERPPLVVPPSRELPAPEQAGAQAGTNPAWPNDPDVGRRKLEAKREHARDFANEFERERRPLRPDELTPGGNPGNAPSGRTIAEGPGADGTRLSPSQLGYKGGIFSTLFGAKDKEESAQFTGEPPRNSLTDPPAGYRTPSAAQPYGVGKAEQAPKATDYSTTHGTDP
jgi:hypothetical protein